MNRNRTAIRIGCLTAAYVLALLCFAAPGSPSRVLKANTAEDQVNAGKTISDRSQEK